MTPKQMGRRLKQIRGAQRLSRRELAEKAGISREYVRKLEAGLQAPTVSLLQRLAKALEVSMDEVTTDTDAKLRRLKTAEVLREATLGARTGTWFEGRLPDWQDPHTANATKALAKVGLIARTKDGRTYRATDRGREFLRQHGLNRPDWLIRAARIDFR